MQEHALALIVTFWFSLIILLISKRLGYFQPFEGDQIPLPWKITFQAFLLFTLLQFLLIPLGIGAYLKLTKSPFELTPHTHGWLNLIAIACVGSALSIFCYFQRRKMGFLLKSTHLRSDISLGLMTWVISYPLVLFFSNLLTLILEDWLGFALNDQIAVSQIRNVRDDPILFALIAIGVIVIVPILEELLFRGFLQSSLLNIFSRFQSITLTSAIFALFHFSLSQGINNINILGNLFLLSLFLGYLKERQGNLYSSITLHVAFNAFSVLLIQNT